jgi:Berberine and berberine like
MLEEGERRLRASLDPHFDRLVDVKTRWDPTNVFGLNHNVPPRQEKRAA